MASPVGKAGDDNLVMHIDTNSVPSINLTNVNVRTPMNNPPSVTSSATTGPMTATTTTAGSASSPAAANQSISMGGSGSASRDGSRDDKKNSLFARPDSKAPYQRVAVNYDPAPLQTDLVQRQGHVKVDLYARLLRMLNVNHAEQSFTAEYLVFAEWTNPALIGLDEKEGSRRAREWLPKISIKNSIKTSLISSDTRLVDVRGRVRWTQHIRCSLADRIHLHAFPFDRHELSICFSSEHTAHELELSIPKPKPPSVVECFGHPDFTLASTLLDADAFEMPDTSGDNRRHYEATVAVTIYRNQTFAVYNLWMAPFLLGLCLSFAFFWSAGDLSPITANNTTASAFFALGNRQMTSFMVLIGAVIYRGLMNSSLPRVSYATYYDRYYLGLYSFIFLQMSESAIVAALYKNGQEEGGNILDTVARFVFPFVWVLYNVIVWAYGWAIATGRTEYNRPDGVHIAYSVAEYNETHWLLSEPISARQDKPKPKQPWVPLPPKPSSKPAIIKPATTTTTITSAPSRVVPANPTTVTVKASATSPQHAVTPGSTHETAAAH